MRFEIDRSEAVPVLRQIVDQIRVQLVQGTLKPGEALPPVRRVAMEIQVHFNTVAEAYRQLAEEGWLEIRHGRSALVKQRNDRTSTETDWRNFRVRMRALMAEMQARGLEPRRMAEALRSMADEVGR